MTKAKASTTSNGQGRPFEAVAQEEPRIVVEPRLELDSGNYATLHEDIVHVYLPSGQELFGVSVHVIPFEAKILGSVMQVYLLGLNRGRSSESNKIQGKLTTMIKLVFDQ
jgi:hypothetical protein